MSTPALPAGRDLRPAAATLLATAGGSLVAVAAAVVVLQKAGDSGSAGAILALAIGGLWGAALAPRWLLAGWMALTWMSLGQSVYGGLPSPVQLGGMAFAGWGFVLLLRRTPVERRTLATGIPVFAAIALPLLISALLSPEGSFLPKTQLTDLSFLIAPALMLRSRADAERIAVALVVCGVVLGVGAAYSVLVHPTAIFKLDGTNAAGDVQALRAAGPFGESNFFALSLAVLVPFALHVLSRGGWHRLLGLAGVAALAGGILASGSRGGMIAFGAAALGYAALTPGRSRVWAIVGVVTLAALMPLFTLQLDAAGQRTVSGRATENHIALAMFADHPISGVGPLVYPELYRNYARRIGNDPRPQREPHSLPLEILAEQGIAGAIGWLVALGLLGAAALRAGVGRIPIGRAVLLSIGTYGVCSLFLHGSQQRLLFLLLGMVLGLTAVAVREAERRRARAV